MTDDPKPLGSMVGDRTDLLCLQQLMDRTWEDQMAAPAERWTPTDLLATPTCLCGARMDLARIEPHPTIGHAELRAYECRECNHALVKILGDDR